MLGLLDSVTTVFCLLAVSAVTVLRGDEAAEEKRTEGRERLRKAKRKAVRTRDSSSI